MTIFFLAFVAAVALLLQHLMASRGLDHLDGEHCPDRQVVDPGEEFHIDVTLQNKSHRFVPFLRVREQLPEGLHATADTRIVEEHTVRYAAFTTWLRPRQQMVFHIPVSAAVRGRYALQQLLLCSGDFLGLKEQSKECGHFNEVVVAPKEAPSMQLNALLGGFMGEMSVRRFILEDPVLTLGYREYTGQEPMKTISWTQSARGMGLMVKKNDYTVEPSVAVLLNVETSRDDRAELLERCFSLARTVCGMLEKQGVKYSFVTNAALAGEFTAVQTGEGLGRHHFFGILEQLGRATYISHTPARTLLSKEARRPTAAGRIFITPCEDESYLAELNRLREAAGDSLLVLRATEVDGW